MAQRQMRPATVSLQQKHVPLHTASETETVSEEESEREVEMEMEGEGDIPISKSTLMSSFSFSYSLRSVWGTWHAGEFFFNLTQLLYGFDSRRFELGDPKNLHN